MLSTAQRKNSLVQFVTGVVLSQGTQIYVHKLESHFLHSILILFENLWSYIEWKRQNFFLPKGMRITALEPQTRGVYIWWIWTLVTLWRPTLNQVLMEYLEGIQVKILLYILKWFNFCSCWWRFHKEWRIRMVLSQWQGHNPALQETWCNPDCQLCNVRGGHVNHYYVLVPDHRW